VPDRPPLGIKQWPAPVQIKEIEPDELRYTVTYLFQGWWPFRPTLLDENGERLRANRQRLPEPRHTKFLLWLDQRRIQDLYLLLKHRLRPPRSKQPAPSCSSMTRQLPLSRCQNARLYGMMRRFPYQMTIV
jgi:hypothetical protein